MTYNRDRKARPPLDRDSLERLAIAYVGRYATTRAKLNAYLSRKLKERGWSGEEPARIDALCDKCVRLGFIDDAAFAAARATALGRRGYGARRVDVALRAAGVGEADGSAARAIADEGAFAAAMRFAERKRIGPYASAPPDDAARRRQFAAMMRAGHSYNMVRKVLRADPDELEDEDLR